MRVISKFLAWIGEQIALADAENLQPAESLRSTIVTLAVAAVSLTLIRYFGKPDIYASWAGASRFSDETKLYGLIYWSCFCCFAYVVLPLVAMRVFNLGRLRDVGVSFSGFRRHVKLYVLLFLPVLVAVVLASRMESFLRVYPFYQPVEWNVRDVILFEVFYGLQFVWLEFFFRGFLVHIPKRRLGAAAVFVMMVPYCMIHFAKPVQETFGAMIGGATLGVLSLRTRSIAGGCCIHLMVAYSMDAMALYQRGVLSTLWSQLFG